MRSVVKLGQDRGWLRVDLPAQAIGVVMQTVVFGRTLDDVSATPIDQSDWDVFVRYFFAGLIKSP